MHPEAINGGPGNRVTQIPPGALGRTEIVGEPGLEVRTQGQWSGM